MHSGKNAEMGEVPSFDNEQKNLLTWEQFKRFCSLDNVYNEPQKAKLMEIHTMNEKVPTGGFEPPT